MLLTKEAEVKLGVRTVEYYKSLGYEIPMKKASESYRKLRHKDYVYDFSVPIKVKVEHLTKGSSAVVEVLCDYCHKEIMTMTYCTYLKTLKNINKSVCKNCKGEKEREYFVATYGVENPSQLKEAREKYRNRCIEKFGADNYFKTEEFQEKRKDSMISRHGVEYPLQSEEVKRQCKNTCISIYGVDNPAKSQEVRNKIAATNIVKYGGIAPVCSSEVKEKMVQTLYQNSSQKASTQQRYICNLYNGILNFPVKYYNVDIYLPENNLTIEYDGGFHLGNVITGRETQEEFDQKEIIRNSVIKREGYKQMRIISSHDLLPSDQILIQMLSETKQYFTDYPNHSWCEYDIDNSTLRNAENKGGISYDFGELRKIKSTEPTNAA